MQYSKLELVQGDITKLDVDVVVNAANAALCGGGGVDGAIHRAAGPALLAACRTLGGARVGEVKMTDAYDLPARRIAHAVGPVWYGGHKGERAHLRSCYRNALALTAREGLRSIAFPCISTGAYRFPLAEAASIAVETITKGLETHVDVERVVFCCFAARDLKVYAGLLAAD